MGADATTEFDPYAPSSDERYEAMAAVRSVGRRRATDAGYYVATAAGVEQGLRNVNKFVGSFMDMSQLPESDIVLSAIPEPRHGVHPPRHEHGGRRRTAPRRRNRSSASEAARSSTARSSSRQRDGAVDLVETLADPLPSAVIAHITGAPVADHETSASGPTSCSKPRTPVPARRSRDFHPAFAQIHPGHDRRATRRATTRPTTSSRDSSAPTSTASSSPTGRSSRRRCSSSWPATRPRVTSSRTACTCSRRARALPNACVRTARDRRARRGVTALRQPGAGARSRRAGRHRDRGLSDCSTGDRVVFGIASANRDESVYECPAEFRARSRQAARPPRVRHRSARVPRRDAGPARGRSHARGALRPRRRALTRRRLRAGAEPRVLVQRPPSPASDPAA